MKLEYFNPTASYKDRMALASDPDDNRVLEAAAAGRWARWWVLW